jgi:RNA polymerase sigma factor (sigma-70 family)
MAFVVDEHRPTRLIRPCRIGTVDESVSSLLDAASKGERAAWDRLVDRFAGLVWGVARGCGLNASDAGDVSQTTWLRLVEHMDRIRDPERLGGWLATTARHECFLILRRSGRQVPMGDHADLDAAMRDRPREESGEDRVLLAERDRTLWRAFETLPERCRVLLTILMADPPPAYADVADVLEMPVGSIGPTRARCLGQLRRSAVLASITTDAQRSS